MIKAILLAVMLALATTGAFATPQFHSIATADVRTSKLPGELQKAIEFFLSKQQTPVVFANEAVGKFREMAVLAFGEAANFPDKVAYLVFIDPRLMDKDDARLQKPQQLGMAFDKDGQPIGSLNADTAFLFAVLKALDDEEHSEEPDKGI